jgi:FkbM family methyltransferase
MSGKSLMGRLLRFPLRLIPDRAVMPVLQGRLRGKRWIAGSSDHGCWLGSYEYAPRRVFEETITLGSIVYDIGAHVGYYTLLASELVGADGHVYAFEPHPKNIAYLDQHLEINSIQNVTVFEGAVADRSGEAYFKFGPSRSMGKISDQGETRVTLFYLDELIDEGKIKPPQFMKIDVEGAELAVLHGASNCLRTHHPTLFLETHSDRIHQESLRELGDLGYELKPLTNQTLNGAGTILAVSKA